MSSVCEITYNYVKGEGWVPSVVFRLENVLASDGKYALIKVLHCPEGVSRSAGFTTDGESFDYILRHRTESPGYARGPRSADGFVYPDWLCFVYVSDLR